jgi:hypothetical protein
MNQFRVTLLILTISFSVLFSCTSNEVGNSSDVNPETIYFDYKIWGEEGNDEITVMLQYRYGGPHGTTLLLDSNSKVELDGELLKADSSRFTGAFYELQKPVQVFAGKHTIIFTSLEGKQYKESFEFRPVSLLTNIPETIKRGDLVFEIGGLNPTDYVRVLLTDTAFTSNGISRVDTVSNGRLLIKKDDLKELVNGPIALELQREEERPVKNGTAEGGRISISYRIKRDFFLAD